MKLHSWVVPAMCHGYALFCWSQLPGDAADGRRPQQHRQDAATHRRSRPVSSLPDPEGAQGTDHAHPSFPVSQDQTTTVLFFRRRCVVLKFQDQRTTKWCGRCLVLVVVWSCYTGLPCPCLHQINPMLFPVFLSSSFVTRYHAQSPRRDGSLLLF